MATCPGLRLILLIFNAVGVRAYECNFSSPDAKYMIEYLPNSFQYQTARIPIPGKSNTLHINLAITGLKLMRADSKAVPYVWNSTSYWIEESAKRIKEFSNGCVDEVNGNTVTCYYNGSTLLDADYQYLDETAMFFYADNIDSAPNPLCSLHIIKYEKAREKLFGTFKYDEDRSENEPTLYFRFIPAVDAFPQTIYVKPTLTCLGGAHTYNLTQISTEDNVFTMERSGFRSSIDCKIKINNEKDSKELNVVLPTIQQLTTLPPITTSKDQTPTVLGDNVEKSVSGISHPCYRKGS